jgi:hypothetical protein
MPYPGPVGRIYPGFTTETGGGPYFRSSNGT